MKVSSREWFFTFSKRVEQLARRHGDGLGAVDAVVEASNQQLLQPQDVGQEAHRPQHVLLSDQSGVQKGDHFDKSP